MKIRNIDLGRYPIFLAPMEDVTDPAFRLMCKKFGADMVYTEFVSADALIRSVGKTMQKLKRRGLLLLQGRHRDAAARAAHHGCQVRRLHRQ